MFSITTSSTGINAIIFIILAITLYLSWRREKKVEQLKFFTIALAGFGMQQFLFSIGTIFGTNNPAASNWCWALAHAFMFVGIAYLLRFAMRMRYMRRESQVFKLVLGLSVVGEIILILSRTAVKPFYLPSNHVFNWAVPPLPGATIAVVTTITLVATFWVFVSNIRSLPSKVLKFRSIAFALGILLFLVGGPMHNVVKTPLLNFLADATLDVGVIVMAVAVYIPKLFKEKQSPAQSASSSQ